jgi:hypothetical protein
MLSVSSPHDPSVAAEQARARLHEEIERVRVGVEEMLAEQEGGGDPDLRKELEEIREETKRYVKRRVRKVEKRMDKRIGKLEHRIDHRIDQVEQDRKYAEWRIHTNTESMLDGLLREVRAVADLLTRTR